MGFEQKFVFSLVVFCLHVAFQPFDFTVFLFFVQFFIRMVLPFNSKYVSGPLFFMKNHVNSMKILYIVSKVVLLCFGMLSLKFLLRPYDVTITSNLLFVHSFTQF